MNTVHILLTCSNCGNTYWKDTGDGEFECVNCGRVEPPENMYSETRELDSLECFGAVHWNKADLFNALRERGYPATEENIAKLFMCCRYRIEDHMIEAGWDYICGQIESEFGPEDMEESK